MQGKLVWFQREIEIRKGTTAAAQSKQYSSNSKQNKVFPLQTVQIGTQIIYMVRPFDMVITAQQQC